MQKFQAQALSQLGEGLNEYNRGALTALGHAALYEAWSSALMGLEIAAMRVNDAENDLLGSRIMSFGEFPKINPALHQEVRVQRSRVDAAWAPIQRLKDQALEMLGAADPLGMGQAS